MSDRRHFRLQAGNVVGGVLGATTVFFDGQNTATTHTYRATFSYQSSAYPPPALRTTSPDTYVTWANNGWTVSLSAYSGIDATTVNVTANVPTRGTTWFFIAGLPFGYPVPPPATLPPPSIQASSNTVTAYAVIG